MVQALGWRFEDLGGNAGAFAHRDEHIEACLGRIGPGEELGEDGDFAGQRGAVSELRATRV